MSSLVEQIGWTLVHFLWQGCLLGLVLWIGLICAKRSDARVRYAMCCGALIALALCPIGTTIALRGRVAEQSPAVIHRTVQVVGHSSALPAHPVQAVNRPVQSQLKHYLPAVVVVWLCGVLVLSVRMVGGLWVVERLRRRWSRSAPADWQAKLEELQSGLGLVRRVQLLVSDRITVPVAMGVFKAVVILPSSLLLRFPPDQVECLLLHELAHVRRHDYLVNLLQTCVETLLFYHPVVWWVSHNIRSEREHCCDEIVIRSTGNSRLYARALTHLEQQLAQSPQFSMSAHGGHLMNRVARILSKKQSQRNTTAVWPSIVLITALAIGLGGTVHAQTTKPKPKPKPAVQKHIAKHHVVATNKKKHLVTITTATTRSGGQTVTIKGASVTSNMPMSVNLRSNKGVVLAERVSTTRLGSKTKLSISGTDVVVNETRFSGPNTEPGEISLTMDGNSISQALSEIASQAHNFSYSIAPPNPMQRFKYEPVHISLSHATLIQAIKAVAYAARANYRFEDGTYYFELRPVQLDGAPMADGGLGGGGFGGGIDPRGGHGGTFGGGGMGGGIAPRGGQGGGFGGGGISGGQLEVPDYFRSNGGGFIGGVSTGQSTMNVSVKDTAGKPEEVTYDLNLRDCDLRGAIKMLCGRILSNLPVRRFAIKSGTNVGRITLKQDHLTFEEALTAICKASGNQYHIDPDGVVVIAPAETPTPPHT